MTAVWVLSFQNDYDEHRVVAATATLDGAQTAATDDLDPDWPTLEWFENPGGIWVTGVVQGIRYTAEQFEVQP